MTITRVYGGEELARASNPFNDEGAIVGGEMSKASHLAVGCAVVPCPGGLDGGELRNHHALHRRAFEHCERAMTDEPRRLMSREGGPDLVQVGLHVSGSRNRSRMKTA